jgi:hypothetical protein
MKTYGSREDVVIDIVGLLLVEQVARNPEDVFVVGLHLVLKVVRVESCMHALNTAANLLANLRVRFEKKLFL